MPTRLPSSTLKTEAVLGSKTAVISQSPVIFVVSMKMEAKCIYETVVVSYGTVCRLLPGDRYGDIPEYS